jgi:hypothetical protein
MVHASFDMTNVQALVQELLGLIDHATSKIKLVDELAAKVKEIQKGERGEAGQDGITPVKGIHYFDGADGRDGINGVDGETPQLGVHYWTPKHQQQIKQEVLAMVPIPKDGEDAVIDDAVIQNVVDTIKEQKLNIDHISGLRDTIDKLGREASKSGYIHGGGDTVAAGTGVAITTNSQGQRVISVVSSAPTPLTPTGAVNGVNASFVVASRPSSVISDGITYFENSGYTYAALTITLDVPPSQYIRYYA